MTGNDRMRVLLLVAGLVLPSVALAQAVSEQPSTRYLSGTCTNCHGTQGRSPGAMPSLAGLSQAYFVEQMKQFREGKRPSTIMQQIAKGYSDEQTDGLAEYFARQTPLR